MKKILIALLTVFINVSCALAQYAYNNVKVYNEYGNLTAYYQKVYVQSQVTENALMFVTFTDQTGNEYTVCGNSVVIETIEVPEINTNYVYYYRTRPYVIYGRPPYVWRSPRPVHPPVARPHTGGPRPGGPSGPKPGGSTYRPNPGTSHPSGGPRPGGSNYHSTPGPRPGGYSGGHSSHPSGSPRSGGYSGGHSSGHPGGGHGPGRR